MPVVLEPQRFANENQLVFLFCMMRGPGVFWTKKTETRGPRFGLFSWVLEKNVFSSDKGTGQKPVVSQRSITLFARFRGSDR